MGGRDFRPMGAMVGSDGIWFTMNLRVPTSKSVQIAIRKPDNGLIRTVLPERFEL